MDNGKLNPTAVTDLDLAFGGRVAELMPEYSKIPQEFKSPSNRWVAWQSKWFFSGLKGMPKPKEGIDLQLAMRHLQAIQGSFEPKHEHKSAAVAYLASQWFEQP